MWIFMNDAYLSIVAPSKDPSTSGLLLVRARIKGDIAKVFPEAVEKETTDSDYRFRALLPRSRVMDAMLSCISKIDYTNFKNTVSSNDDRHGAYLKVWEVLADWQNESYS